MIHPARLYSCINSFPGLQALNHSLISQEPSTESLKAVISWLLIHTLVPTYKKQLVLTGVTRWLLLPSYGPFGRGESSDFGLQWTKTCLYNLVYKGMIFLPYCQNMLAAQQLLSCTLVCRNSVKGTWTEIGREYRNLHKLVPGCDIETSLLTWPLDRTRIRLDKINTEELLYINYVHNFSVQLKLGMLKKILVQNICIKNV